MHCEHHVDGLLLAMSFDVEGEKRGANKESTLVILVLVYFRIEVFLCFMML